MIKAIIIDTKGIDEALLDEMLELASNLTKEKSSKFAFLKDKKLSVSADIALQYLLSFETQFQESILECHFSKKGKPFLLNLPNLFFNISHSNEKCAVAISYDKQIGIDIEHIDSVNEEETLIMWERIFGDVSNFSKPLFIEKWTQIEAYYKMTGEGLSFCSLSKSISIDSARICTKAIDEYFCSFCIDDASDFDIIINELNSQEDIINMIHTVKLWKSIQS